MVDLLPALLDFVELDEPLLVRAQRARAAAASFARVAADMGRRRPSVLVAADEEEPLAVPVLPPVVPPRPPPKSELSRFSSDWICSRSETASFNFSSDKSMRPSYAKRTLVQQSSGCYSWRWVKIVRSRQSYLCYLSSRGQLAQR